MKKIVVLCSALFGMALVAQAQVGIGTKTPSADAMLDIVSTANDKGVILPKVKLKGLNQFLSVPGQSDLKNIGMMVYNTTVDSVLDLAEGFYFWNGTKWERFVDETYLKEVIQTIIPDPGGTGSAGDIRRYVIYDETSTQFLTIEVVGKLPNGDPDIRTTIIPMDIIVKNNETKTTVSKREDTANDAPGSYGLAQIDPAAEKGKIVYKYAAEGQQEYFFDISSDVYSSIVNNEKIKNELNNIITNVTKGSGGNVFYGKPPVTDPTHPTEPSLYEMKVAGDSHTYHLIDISSTILNIFEKNEGNIINKIRNLLGYNIVNEAVTTGNKLNGKLIYTYLQPVVFETNNAQAKTVTLPASVVSLWGNIYKTVLLNSSGAALPNTITDVAVVGNQLDFSLGQGMLYTPIDAGTYQLVIEFVEK